MSRNFFPALFAIGVGVFTGYYTFQPTFKQLQYEKQQAQTLPRSDPAALKQDTNSPTKAEFQQDPKSTNQ
ncbi:hypothetical protein E8E15_009362 [Penicillium rubens]|uniref:Uncharacterized protein n=1 Tax=Penicillium chrysogenum TaxID=5076 RepID=A0A162CQF5_PENCH|nr:uncharacterized protein N7489_007709 [Penicillium chrysogenum]XP_061071287.1 uncharacterized protein N7525_001811 [Penicillium rubens]KAF3028946.1 hypothetical protein E8E15_009362 [Penicillium rubens]KAJ5034240.1 hypothetical protein NUH16_005672 [Penicillium rubens]KAJ5237618.1 hypothetical protein N7489_007709 [Penicillium chrysogenum]KAJ5262119.1 hypothetical protein N7505_008986 [Penicillium chrysogenum]KAJ5277918.1 hypothetical protein N7524_004071 [Penicillium chrysogenum]